jgi:hypothetical protein
MMTCKQVGLKYGLTAGGVLARLKTGGYITRNNSKAQLLSINKVYDKLPDSVAYMYTEELMTMKDIGKKFGCCETSVRKKLDVLGVNLRERGELRRGKTIGLGNPVLNELRKTKNDGTFDKFEISKQDLLCKYCDNHMTMLEIAKEYGCSLSTIKKRLLRFNIAIRHTNKKHRKIKLKIKREVIEHPADYYILPTEIPNEGREIGGKLLGKEGTYVWHFCQSCGNGRWIYKRALLHNVFKGMCLSCIHKSPEYRENKSEAGFKVYNNPDAHDTASMASRKMWGADPIRKNKQAELLRSIARRPDVIEAKKKSSRKYWDDPDWGEYRREKMGKHMQKMSKLRWEDKEYRDKMTRCAKQKFENETQKNKQIRAMRMGAQVKPTSPELDVLGILDDLYPKQWKYVGNGEVVISGKNPDFINTNGKKQIIEMFGTYYHSYKCNGECPLIHQLQRQDIYAKYGYKTLVIWQHELKNIKELKDKIVNFC